MPEPILYPNKTMQSGIFLLQFRTEMTDAGMPMPALVLRVPMPNYVQKVDSGGYASCSMLCLSYTTNCSMLLTLVLRSSLSTAYPIAHMVHPAPQEYSTAYPITHMVHPAPQDCSTAYPLTLHRNSKVLHVLWPIWSTLHHYQRIKLSVLNAVE
jgi:hypothetical protein